MKRNDVHLVAPRFVFYYPREASVFYPEGSSVTLVCRIYAVPMANITWIYRNQRKQTRGRTTFYSICFFWFEHDKSTKKSFPLLWLLVLHQGENLLIESLEPSDTGSYECRVYNGYHSTIGRTFDINVHCKFELIRLETTSRSLSLINWFLARRWTLS